MIQTVSKSVRLALVAMLGYLVLLAPLWLNGAPFYWPDSFAYLKGGGTALQAVLDIDTRYVSNVPTGEPASSSVEPTQPVEPESTLVDVPFNDERISSARSPYYAVVLAGLSSFFGPACPVFIQAFLMLASVGMVLRAIFGSIRTAPALVVLGAMALSAAGIFTSLLLPDFLAPLALLSVAVLFAFWRRLRRWDIVFWYLILITSILSHTTHLAIALFMIPFGIIFALCAGCRPVARPAGLVLSAIVVGVLSSMVFSKAVESAFGYKPQSFPMVAASIMIDGTGRAYLESTCPENGFVYCDQLDTKATEVDQFLWSTDPSIGVYTLADTETRLKMSDQQWAFLVDTLKFDFWAQVRASSQRMWTQIRNNSLGQLTYVRTAPSLIGWVPEPDLSGIQNSAVMRDANGLMVMSQVTQWIGWISFFGVLVAVVYVRRADFSSGRAEDPTATYHALVVFTLLLLLGILINAGLTGAASQPQGRYGARVFLLLPILFGIWVSWVVTRRKGKMMTNQRSS